MAQVKEKELPYINHRRGIITLSPLLVFFLIYVGSSIAANDFYAMPVALAFLAASAWAFAVCKPKRFAQRVERFSAGAAHSNIIMMIWIFILAGAFAEGARYIGSVDAVTHVTINLLPSNMLLPGVFMAACFLSLSTGTSVGTILALMPIVSGIISETSYPAGIMVGAVVGGAFFGDNLSFVSDTTIAATRTQGCAMHDKFKANFSIVLPAALIVLAIYVLRFESFEHYSFSDIISTILCIFITLLVLPYLFLTIVALLFLLVANLLIQNSSIPDGRALSDYLLIIPYLIVLLCALRGMNVIKVLFLGIASTGVGVLLMQHTHLMEWAQLMGKGISNMGELIIVTLLAAGMLELIRYNGGLSYIITHLSKRIRGRRSAELNIGLMASFANLCTANNTVAIVSVGNIARKIAKKYGISPARTAGLLDTFSCFTQALIPYGAQLLAAADMANINAMEIIPHLYYPFAMALSALIFIRFRFGCDKSSAGTGQ